MARGNRFADKLKQQGAGEEIVKAGKDITETISKQENDNIVVQRVDIDNMISNSANAIYSISGIDELANNIKENNLIHNIVLRPLDNGKYRIISGHRRREALRLLVERDGITEFKTPLCNIRYDIDDDLNEQLALHKASINDRELSDIEKAKQAKELQEIYRKKKERGDILVGKVRDLIGADMGISGIQAQRYLEMNDKLIPEMQQLIDDNIISGSAALEFKKRSEEEQKIIVESIRAAYSQGIEISRDEAKKINEKVSTDLKTLENSFSQLQEEFRKASKSAEEAINEKISIENKYQDDIQKKAEEEKILKDEIEKLKKSSDSELKEKLKEYENQLEHVTSEKENIKKSYEKKIKDIENQASDSKSNPASKNDTLNIKANLELNMMIVQFKELMNIISGKLKEYSTREDFELSKNNSDLLLKIKKDSEKLFETSNE